MGVQEWILISDPKILYELLVRRGAIASDRPFTNFASHHYALGKRGIVLSDANRKWKNLRSAALSILSPKSVNEFGHILLSEADALVDDLIERGAEGFDPERRLKLTSLNYVLNTIFGTRVASERDPLFVAIDDFLEEGLVLGGPHNDIGGYLPSLGFVDKLLGREKMFRDFIKKKRDPIFSRLIKIATDSDKDCLVKRLMEKKDEYGLEDVDIMIASNDLTTGGTDTTAGTLLWILCILLHYPDARRRIAAEIDAFLLQNKRYPEFGERDQFPYLIAVQKECMRYRPLGHWNPPMCLSKTVQACGYVFDKGAWIFPIILPIHMNPDIYPEPEKFLPERFLDNQKTMMAAANGKLEERDHFLFGFGRRVCPGIHLAEVQMFNILVRIFARCTVEPCLDAQGTPLLPDLDAMRDCGVTVLPPHYRARFLARSDALV
ncbi:cytochrome P450 [Dichotomocladium elegans]|nr:cytochrome P450 [Dichotomocladium elegans]